MRDIIKELSLQSMTIVMNGSDPDGDIDKMYIPSEFINKFAELIIAECRSVALGEIVEDTDIDSHSDPLLREYLKGNNGGVVDSIVAIQQHFFGVEE